MSGMVSPPVMVGRPVSVPCRITALRKCTRSVVCCRSMISTKSIPLYSGDWMTAMRRSFAAMSAHHDLGRLQRLGLDQHIFDLHQDLRLVVARAGGDLDVAQRDLIAQPARQVLLNEQSRGGSQGLAVRREQELPQAAAELGQVDPLSWRREEHLPD